MAAVEEFIAGPTRSTTSRAMRGRGRPSVTTSSWSGSRPPARPSPTSFTVHYTVVGGNRMAARWTIDATHLGVSLSSACCPPADAPDQGDDDLRSGRRPCRAATGSRWIGRGIPTTGRWPWLSPAFLAAQVRSTPATAMVRAKDRGVPGGSQLSKWSFSCGPERPGSISARSRSAAMRSPHGIAGEVERSPGWRHFLEPVCPRLRARLRLPLMPLASSEPRLARFAAGRRLGGSQRRLLDVRSTAHHPRHHARVSQREHFRLYAAKRGDRFLRLAAG